MHAQFIPRSSKSDISMNESLPVTIVGLLTEPPALPLREEDIGVLTMSGLSKGDVASSESLSTTLDCRKRMGLNEASRSGLNPRRC